jgi:hypothetical protein
VILGSGFGVRILGRDFRSGFGFGNWCRVLGDGYWGRVLGSRFGVGFWGRDFGVGISKTEVEGINVLCSQK